MRIEANNYVFEMITTADELPLTNDRLQMLRPFLICNCPDYDCLSEFAL